MALAFSRALCLLCIGLLAGSALANFLLESALPAGAVFNIEYKQLVIRAYTVALPALGVGGILGAAVSVMLGRRDRLLTWTSLAALACVLAGLVVTLSVHFPINFQVIKWSPSAPPQDWRALFDRWRAANTVRTVLAIAAFLLVLVPDVRRVDSHHGPA